MHGFYGLLGFKSRRRKRAMRRGRNGSLGTRCDVPEGEEETAAAQLVGKAAVRINVTS